MKPGFLLAAAFAACLPVRAQDFGMGGAAAPAAPAASSASAPSPSRAKRPAPAAPSAGSASAVGASSGTAKASVDDVYGGAKMRDPFMKLVGAGAAPPAAAPVKEYEPEDLSIHALELKGILRDKAGPMALIFDPGSGMSFILRSGKLFDAKKKAVPGVTGSIKMEQKTVTLMTADKDVQTLRLGETAAEAEE